MNHILPKKQQPRINRPELERIWKDTERILAEHAFVHDHKFSSLQAIVDYRKGLSQLIEILAAQRAEISKQMRRKDASPELTDRRAVLTCKIAELRKEDKIAETYHVTRYLFACVRIASCCAGVFS